MASQSLRHKRFKFTDVLLLTSLTALSLSVAACSSEPKKPMTIDQKIQREMSFHEEEQVACFVDYQNRRGVIYGDLAFQFEVLKNGHVSWIKVRDDKSNLHDAELRKCMIASITKIHFPPLADRAVVVDAYPFHFRR